MPAILRPAAAAALVLVLLGTASFAQSALAQLGIPDAQARESALVAVNAGYFSPGEAGKAFRNAPPAVRKGLVEGLAVWLKTYTASAEFTRLYAQARENNKPEPPRSRAAVDADEKKAHEEQRQSIEAMKKLAASLPPEQRKEMEEGIREAIAALQALESDPALRQMQHDMAAASAKEEQARYERDLADWREAYPEDPNRLIARRLRSFLDLSATVDFGAKLETRDGKLRFVDPAYEARPAEWKMIYRAGAEAVAAARTVAAAWLAEIGTK